MNQPEQGVCCNVIPDTLFMPVMPMTFDCHFVEELLIDAVATAFGVPVSMITLVIDSASSPTNNPNKQRLIGQ